jgi:hypothetical protein
MAASVMTGKKVRMPALMGLRFVQRLIARKKDLRASAMRFQKPGRF